MRTAESKLTEMQKRFVDFYIQTGNATEAARRADLSSSKNFFRHQNGTTKPLTFCLSHGVANSAAVHKAPTKC